MASVAIIDYGINNIRSVRNAVEYCGFSAAVVQEPAQIVDASHIILPGVGAFADAMDRLRRQGFDACLDREVKEKGKPLLAICLGMQLLARSSEEHTDGLDSHKGLGWFDADVRRMKPNDPKLKIPHMGWNSVRMDRDHPVLSGIPPKNLTFYFVHSYSMCCDNQQDVVGCADYGQSVVSIVARDNIVATQFHPEKSQDSGIELLTNFLRWNP